MSQLIRCKVCGEKILGSGGDFIKHLEEEHPEKDIIDFQELGEVEGEIKKVE